MQEFLRIAHRGYSAKYPENTILAFTKAIEAGVDMIELDLHSSRDDELVVIHDDSIDRTSDGRGRVAELTLTDLRKYNFNNGMTNCGFVGIPTLAEVIELADNRVLLNIEIKKDPKKNVGIEKNLVDLLKGEDFLDSVIVSSFDCKILTEIKEIAKEIRTGLIYDGSGKRFREKVRELDVSSVHPDTAVVDAIDLRWLKSCGIKVYPWVVNDRKTITEYRDSGFIDGVMVNDLALFDDLDHAGSATGMNRRK
jgi:glycerophosphoryl diester phosphodiesterase